MHPEKRNALAIPILILLGCVTTDARGDGGPLGGWDDEVSNPWMPEGGGLEDSIPGIPGRSYPNYDKIPDTGFDCAQHKDPGYYGDTEAQCQVFHVCQAGGRHNSFLCPLGTVFNQETFVCDWWFNVDCGQTSQHYPRNGNLHRGSDIGIDGLKVNRRRHSSGKGGSMVDQPVGIPTWAPPQQNAGGAGMASGDKGGPSGQNKGTGGTRNGQRSRVGPPGQGIQGGQNKGNERASGGPWDGIRNRGGQSGQGMQGGQNKGAARPSGGPRNGNRNRGGPSGQGTPGGQSKGNARPSGGPWDGNRGGPSGQGMQGGQKGRSGNRRSMGDQWNNPDGRMNQENNHRRQGGKGMSSGNGSPMSGGWRNPQQNNKGMNRPVGVDRGQNNAGGQWNNDKGDWGQDRGGQMSRNGPSNTGLNAHKGMMRPNNQRRGAGQKGGQNRGANFIDGQGNVNYNSGQKGQRGSNFNAGQMRQGGRNFNDGQGNANFNRGQKRQRGSNFNAGQMGQGGGNFNAGLGNDNFNSGQKGQEGGVDFNAGQIGQGGGNSYVGQKEGPNFIDEQMGQGEGNFIPGQKGGHDSGPNEAGWENDNQRHNGHGGNDDFSPNHRGQMHSGGHKPAGGGNVGHGMDKGTGAGVSFQANRWSMDTRHFQQFSHQQTGDSQIFDGSTSPRKNDWGQSTGDNIKDGFDKGQWEGDYSNGNLQKFEASYDDYNDYDYAISSY